MSLPPVVVDSLAWRPQAPPNWPLPVMEARHQTSPSHHPADWNGQMPPVLSVKQDPSFPAGFVLLAWRGMPRGQLPLLNRGLAGG